MEKEIEIGEFKILKLNVKQGLPIGYKFKDQKEWYWEVVEQVEQNKYKCKLISKIILIETE